MDNYPSVTNSFNNYSIKCKMNWFITEDNKPIDVTLFRYKLTQYSPAVFAEVKILIKQSDIEDFKAIEKLEIKNRKLEVWFDPYLENKLLNKRYNNLKYKFCVYDYSIESSGLTEPYYGNKSGTEAMGEYYMINMVCTDEVFHKMLLDEKFNSFGKTKISDIIKKVVKSNGGTEKIVKDTDYSYIWLQTKTTDYDFIRSLIPYAKSSDGKDLYTFFMFNNECYFAPIGYFKTDDSKIEIRKINNVHYCDNNHSKYLLDKFGSLDNLYSISHGFVDDSMIKPIKYAYSSIGDNLNYSFKQYNGNGITYIASILDDMVLRQNYISNLRHRIYSFNKMISITTEVIPNLTPLNKIEIIDTTKNEKQKELNGEYYICSIEYIYLGINRSSELPIMNLVLCSEVDIDGMEKPESESSSNSFTKEEDTFGSLSEDWDK